MATTADGALVEAARAGDERAFGQLFDAWFDRVHDVSRRIVHDDGIAGEVTQDVFLRAWTKLDTLADVDAFGGWVLRIGRNASLNRLEKERRSTVLDDDAMTVLTDATSPDHDPLARLDQAGRIALVWDAAAALGERDASVLDLHLRHGLGAAELAEELGTNANNAHQVLFTLRKRLGNAVRALVLWRAGHPTCEDLRSVLASAGLTSFGAPMVKAIDRHVDRCDECARDRTERISPAALFAAAPIVAAPALLKSQAAAALGDAGVPMSGSTSAGSATSAVAGPTATPFPDPGAPVGAVGGAIGGGGGRSGDGPEELAEPSDGDGTGEGRSALAKRRLVAAVVVALACLGGLIWWAAAGGDDEEVVAATAPGSTVAEVEAGEPTTTTSLATTTSLGGTPRSGSTVSSTTVLGAPVPTAPDGAPGTTAPGTVTPGTTPPPATSPSTSTRPTSPTTTVPAAPTTTEPAPTTTVPAPTVDGFRALSSTTRCRGGYEWTLVWQTTGADSVQVGPSKGTAVPGRPDGRAVVCAPANSGFTLVASGPGGTAIATVQGRGPTTTTTPAVIVG